MDEFFVATKLGKLTFTHDQSRVQVTGDMDARADWQYRYGEVLYGAFGHIFNVNDCAVCDVLQVLLTSYGSQSLVTSKLTEAKCRKELRSTPPGAIP